MTETETPPRPAKPVKAAKRAPRKATKKAAPALLPKETDGVPGITERQMRHLHVLLKLNGYDNRDDVLEWINTALDRTIESRRDLTQNEAARLIGKLESEPVLLAVDVHTALINVRRDVPSIGKMKRNVEHNYAFRGIDDLIDGVSPVLARHGVHWTFTTDEVIFSDRPTRSGNPQMLVTMRMTYTVFGPRGDSIDVCVYGLGMDTSDKALNKAATACYKTMIGQLLTIPFGHEDGDATSPAYDDYQPVGLTPEQQAETDQLLVQLGVLAGEQDTDLAGITAKFRNERGQMSVEDLKSTPPVVLAALVASIERYINQQEQAKAKAEADQAAQAATGSQEPQ